MSTALRTYYRGDELVGMHDGPGNKSSIFHFDHQGTTQCLTDRATGAVTDRFASDAWGVQVKRTGTSINRQWYIGNAGYHKTLTPLPLLSVRHRVLAATLGAFNSRDSARGLTYVYVLNAPVRWIDPSGLAPLGPAKLVDVMCPACLDQDCRKTGELWLHEALLGSKSDPGSRQATVGLGWKVNPELVPRCRCAAGMSWIQFIKTGDGDGENRKPDAWGVDDNRFWTPLGMPGRLNCEFIKGTPSDPFLDPAMKGQKPSWLKGYQDLYYTFSRDNPARETDYLLGWSKKAKPAGGFYAMEFVTCMMCKNFDNKGFNWIMRNTCVRWGFRVNMTLGKVGTEYWVPEPELWRSEGLVQIAALLNPTNCADSQVKQWVISSCPPIQPPA